MDASADNGIETRVRERAYSLWEQAGRPEGRAEEYWYRARSELAAEDGEPDPETVGTKILTQEGMTTLPPAQASS